MKQKRNNSICYLCKRVICLSYIDDGNGGDCDCELYWKHKCICGPICAIHNVAYDYDDSYCIYCAPLKNMLMLGETCYYEELDLNTKLKASQYWMSIAPKLNVSKDIAKTIALFVIT